MPSYVVTGANRGLGYAFVKHLASIEGNTVSAIARNKDATLERLEKDSIKGVHVFAADITDVKALKAAADGVAQVTGGGLDVLINNAGLVSKRSAWSTLLDDTPEELEEDLVSSFRANVVGIAHTINAFLPLIRKGQQKKVLVLSTGMADLDLVNQFSIGIAAPYAISKAGTNALVAKYNAALGKSEGILFLAISPGYVDTSEGVQPSEQDLEGAKVRYTFFQALSRSLLYMLTLL
jgi:NAD(P)-dependent dehydrogenase (short-subunit alcohol dehydrogenase family)